MTEKIRRYSKKTWKIIGRFSKIYSMIIWLTIISIFLWVYGIYSSTISLISDFDEITLFFGIIKLFCLALTSYFLFWFYVSTRIFRTYQGVYEKANTAIDIGTKTYSKYRNKKPEEESEEV